MDAAAIQSIISHLNRQHNEQMQLMREQDNEQMQLMRDQLKAIAERQNQPGGQMVQATADSARDVKAKNLADSMEAFVYDPEDNAIFESWHKRYETTFTTEVDGWTEPEKVRLLMRKFSRTDYDKFADSILPEAPTDLSLAKVVTLLKQMFGYTETLFKMRYKCFDIRMEETEAYRAYGARINKLGEKFDIASLTSDDLITLLFISGLKDAKHSLVLEKLLNKVNEQQRKLEAITDADARAAIVKLKVNDLINEAQNIISLKKDKSEVSEAVVPVIASEVNVIHSRKPGRVSLNPSSSRSFPSSGNSNSTKRASRPCKLCGEGHWDRDCGFKTKQCESCKAMGHKSGFCATAAEAMRAELQKMRQQLQRADGTVSTLTSERTANRKFLTPRINNVPVRLQVDSA